MLEPSVVQNNRVGIQTGSAIGVKLSMSLDFSLSLKICSGKATILMEQESLLYYTMWYKNNYLLTGARFLSSLETIIATKIQTLFLTNSLSGIDSPLFNNS